MSEDLIKSIIENIFTHTACTISKMDISLEDGMLWFMIETPDSRFMIGREGETLRSLNHLVRKMVEKSTETEEISNIFIDINGYQKKKFDNLKNVAHMMAERAKYFKSNIEVEPMPANERRIIHMFLEKIPDIKTESEGYGPNRRVVIKYVGSNY
ncbi:MAG: R3H domain-containing nucleic acid-binding protein [Candidatus Nomurabacteria bacterium]